MKKHELVKLIQEIVSIEVKKQLPSVISEVFSKLINENKSVSKASPVIKESIETPEITEESITNSSLKELFSNVQPTSNQQSPQPVPQKRYFTKNPILNEVLNNTTSDLRYRDRLNMPPAAYMSNMTSTMGSEMENVGRTNVQFQTEESPSYLSKVPSMDSLITSTGLKMSAPPVLTEGQESSYAPLPTISNGVSVLDFKNQAPAAVSKALNRNYSQLLKVIDSKKKLA